MQARCGEVRGGLWRNWTLLSGCPSFLKLFPRLTVPDAARSVGARRRSRPFRDVVGRSPPCRPDTVAAAPVRAAAPAGEDISTGRRHFSVAQCRISFPLHQMCPRSSHRLEHDRAKHTLAARCGGSGVPACARAPCGAAQRRRRRRRRHSLRHQGGQAARCDSGATRPGSAGER